MGYNTFYANENKRAKRAVRACLPVLKKRLHLDKLIACGVQGCVYETHRVKTVVKVTASRKPDEINQIIWQRDRGWRSHTALPRIHRVYRLNKCAKAAGVVGAYATVRENLTDVAATRHTRAAVTLLERLENALFRAPGGRAAANHALHAFMVRHHTALAHIHGNALAWRVWTDIAHLQIWLAYHALTMGDVRLSNLGIRQPSLQHGQRYDVVMRDMGFLQLRSAAGKARAKKFDRGYTRAVALGAMDAIDFDGDLDQ